jgi:murein DD-endopeptidase MepM/ murein hydrolase activator NlpD
VKTGICAALAIAILIIGTVTAPGAGNGVKADSHAASQEFDIPEDIGKLKFVESLDDVTSVMSVLPDDAAVYPSDGEVVTAFGQAGSCGVRFGAADGTVYSIARGTVAATGEIGGEGYVKTLLDTGETVLYVGLDPLVQTDDIVQPGQIIGTVTADYLYVEMKQGETYVDPAAYIAARAAEGSGAS